LQGGAVQLSLKRMAVSSDDPGAPGRPQPPDHGQRPDHAQREVLAREVHARPFAPLSAPERASHIAMLSGDAGAARDQAHLRALCERAGVAPPPADSNHAYVDFGPFRLKWERHGEFCTWTFFVRGRFDDPFDPPALAAVPADWLAALPGERLVAAHLIVEPHEAPARRADTLLRWFSREYLAGSRIAGGAAEAWTDFRLHEDGFSRILVQDRGFVDAYQAGQVVQRLLEIETYRLLALLALPLAREAGPRISAVDREVAGITGAMSRLGAAGADAVSERQLLERLITLAADIERMTAASDYRFGAARAYYALVERRIGELQEQRLEPGVPTIGEFLDRRLAPAMRSCVATSDRLRAMAERLARAGNLLRTRVDIALEAQNQDLLASMDRRARLQLRLQETVEGLSVAAISYYVIGLLGYGLRAIEDAGMPLRHDLVTGIAIPIVLFLVWRGMRRVRRHIAAEGGLNREP
jgi:uncharacterized membrane-anchored protein